MSLIQKYKASRGYAPTKLIIALLVVLAIVVGGVSVAALSRSVTPTGDGIPTSSAPKPEVTPTPSPAPEPEGTEEPEVPEETPTPEPAPTAVAAVAPDRLLTVVTTDLLVRSMVGGCQVPGTLEFSKDGGATWQESTALSATNSTLHMRVLPTRATNVQLIALDDDCEPHLVRTENQGDSWVAPISAAGAWFFNPESPESIYAPDGKVSSPCTAVSFAATQDRAAVLCSDSSVITTTDKAATWDEPIAVPGAVALNISADGYVVAVANQGECSGVQTLEIEGTSPGNLSSCLEAENLEEGTVAVARTSDSVLAWIGNKFATSPDGGTTWN